MFQNWNWGGISYFIAFSAQACVSIGSENVHCFNNYHVFSLLHQFKLRWSLYVKINSSRSWIEWTLVIYVINFIIYSNTQVCSKAKILYAGLSVIEQHTVHDIWYIGQHLTVQNYSVAQ